MFKRVLHAANQVVTHQETYTGQELCIENTINDKVDLLKVTGDCWQQKTTGVNLADYEKVATNTGNNYYEKVGNGYILTANKASIADRISIIPCNLKAGKTYIAHYDEKVLQDFGGYNTAYLYLPKINQYIRKDYPFAPKADTAEIGIYADVKNYTNNTDVNILISNISVNEGNILLPWEPYTGGIPAPNPDYPLPVISASGRLKSTNECFGGLDKLRESEIVLPELRAIRDNQENIVAQDVLWVDEKQRRAWVERNTKKFIFNGDEKWNDSPGSKVPRFSLYIEKVADSDKGLITSMNTSIPIGSKGSTWSERGLYTIANSAIYISYKDTLDEFISYLRENPLTLLATLKSTVIEEIPYTDHLLSTAQYQTNIRFSDLDEHLKPEIEATVKVLG